VGWALESLFHLLFVENGVEDFVHHQREFTRKDGGEFFEVVASEFFFSFYSFERLVSDEFVFGSVKFGGAFVKDGKIVVGID
jgi:hypothetical protein